MLFNDFACHSLHTNDIYQQLLLKIFYTLDENEKILAKKVKKQVVEEKVACEECGVQMKKHNLQAHVENVHGTEVRICIFN